MQRITNDLFESIRKITSTEVQQLSEEAQTLDEKKKMAMEKEEPGEKKEKPEGKSMEEELVGKQAVLDKNKNGKLDKQDFKMLRGEKIMKEEEKQDEKVDEDGVTEGVNVDSHIKRTKDRILQLKDWNTSGTHDKKIKELQAKLKELKSRKQNENLDEASYSAKAARAGKDIGKPGKMFGKIAASAAKKYGSEERGKKVAGAVLAKLRAKHMKEDVDLNESITETVIKHNDFTIEITDNPTVGDFLKALQSIVPVQEETDHAEIVAAAMEAFDEQNIDVIIEAFTRSDIGEKISAHKKAGNTVAGEKFSVKDGKPYAEYVVTDKDGNRKKYIHHGTTRRMESMPASKTK